MATPLVSRVCARLDFFTHAAPSISAGHSALLIGSLFAARRRIRSAPIVDRHGRVREHGSLLSLRGLRTLAVRLERHTQAHVEIAQWLRERPIDEVIFPRPVSRGHDCGRATSLRVRLFGVLLKPAKAPVDAMLAAFTFPDAVAGRLRKPVIAANVARAKRTIRRDAGGPYLRLHVGLESVDDLIADLADGFDRLRG